MRTLLCTLFIVTLLFGPVAERETHAAILSVSDRTALIQEIQRLTAQVIALQTQLQRLKGGNTAASYRNFTEELYQSRFYDGAYEAIYTVSGTTLIPRRGAIRTGDQAVFNSYRALMGDAFVKDHVSEFRVFNDRDNLMSGFVEQKNDASWLLVINRFDNDLTEESTDQFMIELLLHESAHIVFFLDDRYQKMFTKEFWTTAAMETHADRLERRSALESKASIAANFYDNHPTWFVSDYAPTSPNEDLVETFVGFITHNKPTGSTLADDKINFFYEFPELVTWRSELRATQLITPLLE